MIIIYTWDNLRRFEINCVCVCVYVCTPSVFIYANTCIDNGILKCTTDNYSR